MEEQKEKRLQDDEITLKELILKIQEFWKEILRNLKMLILVSAVFGITFAMRTYMAPITYTAKLTFMVNEDEGGGRGGGISNILGQFGLGGSKSEYNLAKMLELSKSRRIVGEALFKKIAIDDGPEDFLANHLIRLYQLHDDWKGSKFGLDEFFFQKSEVKSFDIIENRALKILVSKVVGNSEEGVKGLFFSSFDEDTAIMKFGVTSVSEEFSLNLVEVFYKTLSQFYIEKSTERQKNTFVLIGQKKDSIEAALSSKQYQLLKFEDTYRNLSLRQNTAQKLELQREIQVGTIAYGKAIENYELADFSLKNATPFFQTIDMPIGPLKSSYSLMSIIKSLIMGGLLGVFLSVGWILGKLIIKNSLEG